MSLSPRVTVLMSVYNGADFLDQSVPSILNQSFTDFEFLIIDDGSTDDTPSILETYASKDPRIRIITQENMGLTRALNTGLKQAKGTFIARQDADDVSHTDRLAKQVQVFDHESVVLCGTCCVNVYPSGDEMQWRHRTDTEITKIISFFSPFAHSTVMMRTDKALSLGGYDEGYKTAQDTDFWIRLSRIGKVTMIEDNLVRRHMPLQSISRQKRWRQLYDSGRARLSHNKTLAGKTKAVYYTARITLINILPISWIQWIKSLKKT